LASQEKKHFPTVGAGNKEKGYKKKQSSNQEQDKSIERKKMKKGYLLS